MECNIVDGDKGTRTGTFIIAEGLGREHFKMLRLIEKHEGNFLKLGDLKKNRLPSLTAGRPVDEFSLNSKQVLFLISLLRSSGKVADFKCSAVNAGNALAVVEALYNFDFGDVVDRKVYAILDSNGNVKIGISADPERRLKELQAANSLPLKLVFVSSVVDSGYKDETRLHEKCEEYSLHGEWFTSEALSKIGVGRECTADRDSEYCQCRKCTEFKIFLDIISKVEDPENNQSEVVQAVIDSGFDRTMAIRNIEILDDIGWPF